MPTTRRNRKVYRQGPKSHDSVIVALNGRFGDTSGAPYVEGRLIIPRLLIETNISFLVDTGADLTVLHPQDSVKMKLPFSELTTNGTSDLLGVGANQQSYLVEPAIILFTEPEKRVFGYGVDILICPFDQRAKNAKELLQLPSLLGRDILDNWDISYSKSMNKLEFSIVKYDFVRNLPKP